MLPLFTLSAMQSGNPSVASLVVASTLASSLSSSSSLTCYRCKVDKAKHHRQHVQDKSKKHHRQHVEDKHIYPEDIEAKPKAKAKPIPDDEHRCTAITKTGERCKISKQRAHTYCQFHSKEPIANKPVVEPPPPPPKTSGYFGGWLRF
jgi:hypothetical protein